MSKNTRWCPYCGEELPSEAVRCSRCGRWLDGPRNQASDHPAAPNPPRTFRRRRRAGLWSVLILLAVVVAVTAALVRLEGAGETTAALQTVTPSPTLAATATPGLDPTPSATALPADLAQQTVQQYWDLISKGSVSAAYDLLSTSVQDSTTRAQFVQRISHLLDVTNGLTATAGTPVVQGDTASVPVQLHFTVGGESQATQRLVWQVDSWRIDQPGTGVSTAP